MAYMEPSNAMKVTYSVSVCSSSGGACSSAHSATGPPSAAATCVYVTGCGHVTLRG